jgi:hypothetical protein
MQNTDLVTNNVIPNLRANDPLRIFGVKSFVLDTLTHLGCINLEAIAVTDGSEIVEFGFGARSSKPSRASGSTNNSLPIKTSRTAT